jgi:hypothetical protein
MPPVYLRSIELRIPIILGCVHWKSCRFAKYDGEKRMIDEQRQ